jgi:hypothetical protein
MKTFAHTDMVSAQAGQDLALKAQNDLLALKLLHDPQFLQRVPILEEALMPGDMLESHGQAQSAQDQAQMGRKATSMPAPLMQDTLRTGGDMSHHLHAPPNHEAAADLTIKDLSDEVLFRVRAQLEELLPELIASTLEEVLNDWSQNAQSQKRT